MKKRDPDLLAIGLTAATSIAAILLMRNLLFPLPVLAEIVTG